MFIYYIKNTELLFKPVLDVIGPSLNFPVPYYEVFSKCFKYELALPIYKTGDKQQIDKLYERLLKTIINYYLERNSILSDRCNGSRKACLEQDAI